MLLFAMISLASRPAAAMPLQGGGQNGVVACWLCFAALALLTGALYRKR
jgi:hypothetical protein